MGKNAKFLLVTLSLILVAIPMVIFPERLGLPLLTGSTVNLLYEVVYYSVVLYLFRRDITLVALLAGAALTLVYRLALGAVLGMIIIAFHGLDSAIAFSLSMTKYLPAVLLQAAAAPFVMRSVYLELAANITPLKKNEYNRPRREVSLVNTHQDPSAPDAAPFEDRPMIKTDPPLRAEPKAVGVTRADESTLINRALEYVSESAAVKIALLVDDEGLPLARLLRSNEDPELWAPLALMLLTNSRGLLHQYGRSSELEKLDITTVNSRIFMRRVHQCTLVVVGDQNVDETIHIRLAQAADMIRKYMSERYGPALFARAEGRYVPNP